MDTPTEKNKKTILLVEDEDMVREVMGEMLKLLGYKVCTAGDGKEALALYEEKKDGIDLIILDMIMPVMSGEDTFYRLREINPELKILICSGYDLNGKIRTLTDRGCNGFMQKPFQLAELSQKVKEIIG